MLTTTPPQPHEWEINKKENATPILTVIRMVFNKYGKTKNKVVTLTNHNRNKNKMNQSEIKANTSNKHYSQSMSCLNSIILWIWNKHPKFLFVNSKN